MGSIEQFFLQNCLNIPGAICLLFLHHAVLLLQIQELDCLSASLVNVKQAYLQFRDSVSKTPLKIYGFRTEENGVWPVSDKGFYVGFGNIEPSLWGGFFTNLVDWNYKKAYY